MSIAHHTRPPKPQVLAPAFDARQAAAVITALLQGSNETLATVSLYRVGPIWNTWRSLPTTLEHAERSTLQEFAARFFTPAPEPGVLQPGQRVMWRFTPNPHSSFPQIHYAQSATIVGKTLQGLYELQQGDTTWSAFACEIHPL